MIRFFLFFFSLFITISYADNCTMFPKNDLSYPVGFFNVGGITEKEFNDVLDDFYAVYYPIFKSEGKTFIIERDWQNPQVNANARFEGNKAIIHLYGGLPRAPEINVASFATVVAHEIFHLRKAYPLYAGSIMSNEGSSDYGGTLKAMRLVYRGLNYLDGTNEMETLCKKSFTSNEDLNLCVRSLDGGQGLGNLLASLSGSPAPKLSVDDPKVVSSTQDSHPSASCRLTTYKWAALCPVSEKIELSSTDERVGACTNYGRSRPNCFFKPKYPNTDGGTDPEPDPCEEDPESCEPEPSDIPKDFTMASIHGALVFGFELSDDCPAAFMEVRKGKFKKENDTVIDPKSYIYFIGEIGEDQFIVPTKYFKRKTDLYLRYFCSEGGKEIFGKASNSKKLRRK